jgi:hypothetical protein
LPPSNETGPIPSPPKDSNANATADLLAVVTPLVTDLVATKDGSGNESPKALTVAELIALTDLLNDSAVSDLSVPLFPHSFFLCCDSGGKREGGVGGPSGGHWDLGT